LQEGDDLVKLVRNILALVLAGFLFIAPFLLFIGVAFTFNKNQTIFGHRIYLVMTASMEPSIKQGDAVIVRLCKPENVKVDDIITYSASEYTIVTHRLVRIAEELDGDPGFWFITKGDNNIGQDPPVPADMLIGKVTGRLPGIGSIAGHLVGTLLIAFCVILLFWGLAVIVLILLALRGNRWRRRPVPAAENAPDKTE